ncbi:Protein SHQ1 [Pseudozyma hubeiensis]|nr:Protein SHQ1 [Pseudozyma hubeiensis]
MEGFSVPEYQVSQDAEHVYVDVTCRPATMGAASTTKPNIAVEGRIFGFHHEPHYLPLVLPGAVTRPETDAEALQIINQAESSAPSSSQSQPSRFRVTLIKVQPGQHFEGLDQVQPQLLPEDQLKQALSDAEQSRGFFRPPGANGADNAGAGVSAGNNAEVNEAARALLQQAMQSQGLTLVNDDDGEAAMDDAAIALERVDPASSASSAQDEGFGFGWRSSFKGALIPAGCADTRNVLEVPDPKMVHPGERERIAIAFEEKQWDEGVYMDNFLDVDGEVAHLLRFQPKIAPRTTSNNTSVDNGANIDIEKLALVVQLLFAYSYDERTNEGDPTVESGWTIAKLSRSLSASLPAHLPNNGSLESVVSSTLIGCVRRALTIPLYRHWELAMACIHDTIRRLDAGASHVLDCLVDIARRLEDGGDDILSRLSEIWVMVLVAQPPTQGEVDAVVACIRSVMDLGDIVTKDSVGGEEWDLQVSEQAARQAFEDGEGVFV